jgi:adenosylhomocysteine nucleosidase
VSTEEGRSLKIVVLISARHEWMEVKNFFYPVESDQTPYGEYFEQNFPSAVKDQPLIFCQGGWGKTNAAGSTQYAIDHWQPDVIINLGTCGGFQGDVNLKEIILVEKSIIYDLVEQMIDPDIALAAYTTNLDLSFLTIPYPQPVRRTLLVSGDRDLVAGEIPGLKNKFGAVAGDWETGSIAYIANINKVKCLILRGVSDLVSPENGGEAYDHIEVFAERTHEIMLDLLGHLTEWIGCIQ